MPSTWTGLKGVKLGKAPPAWRPQGLQGGRLCLPCNPSDERYLHYHQFWLSCQPSIYSKTQHSHWDILGVQSTWQLPGSVLCWVYGLWCHCGVGSPLSAYCQWCQKVVLIAGCHMFTSPDAVCCGARCSHRVASCCAVMVGWYPLQYALPMPWLWNSVSWQWQEPWVWQQELKCIIVVLHQLMCL